MFRIYLGFRGLGFRVHNLKGASTQLVQRWLHRGYLAVCKSLLDLRVRVPNYWGCRYQKPSRSYLRPEAPFFGYLHPLGEALGFRAYDFGCLWEFPERGCAWGPCGVQGTVRGLLGSLFSSGSGVI